MSVEMLEGPTDAELVGRLPTDASAFEELFRRHRRAVISYAARRCNQPADVADLVAATFLAVLETSGGYDPSRGAFRPWLIGVAHRQLGLVGRSERRQRAVTRSVGGQRILSDDALARLEEQIDAARNNAEVEQAVAGLPDRHRELLWMVGHDGLTAAEAAQALGVNPGTFRVRLLRARRALRAALADPIPPPHPPLTKEISR